MSNHTAANPRLGRRIAAAAVALIALTGAAAAGNTLTVVNQCTQTVWMQQMNINQAPPLVELAPGASYVYQIVNAGDSSTRVWPKTGCDATGNNCTIGQSAPNTNNTCPSGGCAPPIDSKVEATFACVTGSGSCPVSGATTSYDGSLVDGFTLPFTITATGSAPGGNCTNVSCPTLDMVNGCPSNENLTSGGKYPNTVSLPNSVSLQSVDLHAYALGTSNVIGCFSPCEKLTAAVSQGGIGLNPTDKEARAYCCPTSSNPKLSVTPEECTAGPVSTTQYVQTIHNVCNYTSYAYAYDDANGNKSCNGYTSLTMTVCPNGQ